CADNASVYPLRPYILQDAHQLCTNVALPASNTQEFRRRLRVALTTASQATVNPLTTMRNRSVMSPNERGRRQNWRVLAGGGTLTSARLRPRLGHNQPEGCTMERAIITLGLALGLGLWADAASAQMLKTVKDRGSLICGVSQGLPGFSNPDDKGAWTGLDVDFCRAIAAAIFNDPSKVKFTPLSSKDRCEPLKSGEIDVLSRNTTWTMSRDALFNFIGVNYYDGQGFIVRKALKVNSALELNGASVCTQTGTTTELNLG